MTDLARQSPPIAVVDIGSSSICLLVVRPREGGQVDVLEKLKYDAKLRAEITDQGLLSSAGIARTLEALAAFRRVIDRHGAVARVVATAALRAAANAAELVARARAETGLEVEVVSGLEEARLAWQGVRFGMASLDEQVLCVDVGGGSTELLLGRGSEALFSASLPVGAIVVSRELLGPDPIAEATVRAARIAIAAELASAIAPLRQAGAFLGIATSGTIQRVARLVVARTGLPAPANVQGLVLSRADIASVIADLAAAPSTEARKRLPGMDPSRADSLLGGALIHDVLGDALRLERWTVSMAGLRMGIVADLLARRRVA